MRANYNRYILDFKRPGGTSRGVLRQKETFFLSVDAQGRTGIGECALFRGLSYDDRPDYEEKLDWLCANIAMDPDFLREELQEFPSILFGWEQAMRSLSSEHPFVLFPSSFTDSSDCIVINGLIWMGDRKFMEQQVEQKLEQGFDTIKMKIGAIDFETELGILDLIRKRYSAREITLRVDANGAFSPMEANHKLNELSAFDIHSIEQPISAGHWGEMAKLCRTSPVPIALDEELIGVIDRSSREGLLKMIRPQYIILKPSLVGGFASCDQWIELCEEYEVGWWITSALESNVGLNAIAQYTYTLGNSLPQGLGTGSLFHNNVDSPLEVVSGKLCYRKERDWANLEELFKIR